MRYFRDTIYTRSSALILRDNVKEPRAGGRPHPIYSCRKLHDHSLYSVFLCFRVVISSHESNCCDMSPLKISVSVCR